MVQGVLPSSASFFRRAFAFVVDNVLVLCVLYALLGLFAWSTGDNGYWTGFLLAYFFYLSIPVIVLYWSLAFALLEWIPRGRSPGKALCGIAVREAESGGTVGLPRLVKRELFRGLLALLLFVPLIVDGLAALWRPRHETWHDKVAGTAVVRLPRLGSTHAHNGH